MSNSTAIGQIDLGARNSGDDSYCIQADIVVENPQSVIDQGEVRIRNGVVEEVRRGWRSPDAIRLNGKAILPGLINCHTHLEFSYLDQPIETGGNFPDWISNVVASRRGLQEQLSTQDFLAFRDSSIQKGLAELHANGTVLACDIVTQPWSHNSLTHAARSSWPTVIPMGEVIGLELERLQDTFRWASSLHELTGPGEPQSELIKRAISPHSPYSLLFPEAFDLFRGLAPKGVAAMHLAESAEEIAWLTQRTGPFGDAFDRIGITPPDVLPSIDDCLEMVAAFEHGLVVHGNFLTDMQLERIATARNLSLVVCPRTHQFFGHDQSPFNRAIKIGPSAVLGTDSRASNPDLSMWLEMSAIRKFTPDLDARQVFAMATTQAAEAIGLTGRFGKIDRGIAAGTLITIDSDGLSRHNFLEAITQFKKSPVVAWLPEAIS